MSKRLAAFVAVLLSLTSTGWSDVIAPMMGAQLPPPAQIYGLNSQVEPGLGITLSNFYSHRNTLRLGREDVGNPKGMENTAWITTALLDYNFTTRFSGMLTLPYVYKRAQESDGDGNSGNGLQPFSEKTNGFGDLGLYAKYAFYKDQEFNARKELQALVGIELPTGRKNDTDTGNGDSANGYLVAAPNQASSRTTNYIVGIAGVQGFEKFSLYADITYKLYGSNASYRHGNVLNLRAGMNLPLPSHDSFRLTNELLGVFARRDRSDVANPMTVTADGKVANTGGVTYFWAPGFQWETPWNFTIQPSVQIPIYQNLLGNNTLMAYQLKSNLNFVMTISSRIGGTPKQAQ